MKKTDYMNHAPAVLTVLRILLGWHFLYEGISKLAMTGWSSSSYLMQSKWLFSGFFHWIVAHPTAQSVTDILNIWGLILIGTGLFLGLFTRASSLAGILMLLLFYIANPPFVDSSAAFSGQYYLINMNLIEAAFLLLFVFLKKDATWGLDRMFSNMMINRKQKLFPEEENSKIAESHIKGRREMLKNLAAVPLFGISFFGMAKKSGWLSFEESDLKKVDAVTSASVITARSIDVSKLTGKVPMGKIKNLEISRLIPGGNLVAGFAHARDLIYVSSMIKNYFTDEKVIETLWLYEACGINTTIMRTDEQTIRILKKYWDRGGKIQWLAQTYPKDMDLTNVKLAVDNGASGAFVMGNIADQMVYDNHLDYLSNAIEYIRSQGMITGTAGHAIQVPMACAKNGIEVDFFMKTFHHDHYWSAQPMKNRNEFMHDLKYDYTDHEQFHDNIWCANSDEVTEFFRNSKTPWIAYKVLAAGAIHPEDGFKYAFENGADFVCAGMFDWQVIDNANTISGILNSGLNRDRGWYA